VPSLKTAIKRIRAIAYGSTLIGGSIAEVPKLWGARLLGALLVLWGASCLYEGHIYLNDIWTNDEIYILVSTLLD
jgi:hypothetical protein